MAHHQTPESTGAAFRPATVSSPPSRTIKRTRVTLRADGSASPTYPEPVKALLREISSVVELLERLDSALDAPVDSQAA